MLGWVLGLGLVICGCPGVETHVGFVVGVMSCVVVSGTLVLCLVRAAWSLCAGAVRLASRMLTGWA